MRVSPSQKIDNDKYNIKLMEHHFSNQQIEGLTLIDDQGISFSYERDNPKVKQNFTKCHELGHFLLGHSGSFFTEQKDKNDSQTEKNKYFFSYSLDASNCITIKDIL